MYKRAGSLYQISIFKYSFNRDTMDVVKQSAALCLLRLLRTAPDVVPGGEWTSRIVHLLNDQHLGVVTAAASLIDALVKRNPDEYKGCVSLAVSRLSRVRTSINDWSCNIKTIRLTDISSTIVDRYIELYRSAGLYILLCTSPVVICQVATFTAELYSTRYWICIWNTVYQYIVRYIYI